MPFMHLEKQDHWSLTQLVLYSRGSQTFPTREPQNNGVRHWGPPSTLEVACNVVHGHARALLDFCKHRHEYITKEQQPRSHNIILK